MVTVSVIKTQSDIYTDKIYSSAYGIDSTYDKKSGGIKQRKGVGKIEDGPTIPRAKSPTVAKVKAGNPTAEIPTAQFASTVQATEVNPFTGNTVTDGQAQQMKRAKSKVSAYISKSGGAI